jgi:hypothetical protein
MQDMGFSQQRDGQSGQLGCYSGSKSPLSPASIFFDYFYSRDRGNVLCSETSETTNLHEVIPEALNLPVLK